MDVGGNWLRFYRHGSSEDDPAERRSGLLRVLDVAARQGDSRGDEAQAIAVLDAGLARHPYAPRSKCSRRRSTARNSQREQERTRPPHRATASALLADHQVGPEAEPALTLALEAELTSEQHNEVGRSGEEANGSKENDSPSG